MIKTIVTMLVSVISFLVGTWHVDLTAGSGGDSGGWGSMVFTNGIWDFSGFLTYHIGLYLMIFGMLLLLITTVVLMKIVWDLHKSGEIKLENNIKMPELRKTIS